MARLIDLTGRRFGMLVALSMDGVDSYRQRMWRCVCDCGRTVVMVGRNLRSGNSKSCGCRSAVKATHKMSKTRIYNIWSGMITRTTNPAASKWKHYGGRGITVCDAWRDFENFYADMGDPEGKTLERVNNNAGYSKQNCVWADQRTQSGNRRVNVRVSIGNKEMCLAAACRLVGVNYGTARTRLFELGWPADKALCHGAKVLQREIYRITK